MKKITIVLLSIFFVSITSTFAQDEVKTTQENTDCPFTINAEGEKICTLTGTPECSPKQSKSSCCKTKSKSSCCKTKSKSSCCKTKSKSSCSKNTSKGEFNYGKKNNYSGKKSSCNKKTKKKCCSTTASNTTSCAKTNKTSE